MLIDSQVEKTDDFAIDLSNTILFLDDWKRFPSAIIHTNTRNKSFLRMAQMYKSMGIKNCFFHLALIDPSLEFIDPHSPDLTHDQMLAIGMECRWNPWYYFREVALVPPQASQTPSQLRANRGNLALWWLFFNHIDVALIQPRQTGKSLSVDELMDYLIDIGSVNTKIRLLTKDETLRKENIERLKAIRELIPPYLKMISKSDTDNKEEITNNSKGNKYRTSVGQSSEVGANKVGRGNTSPVQQVDEGPFMLNVHIMVPAMMAAGNAVRKEAALAGAPYGNIFTTTAGKKDDKSGKYMFNMIHSGMPWTEHLFDSRNILELRDRIEKVVGEESMLVNCTFSHRQLGYTDDDMKEWIKNSKADSVDQINRDFFNVWSSGGQRSALSIELSDLIRSSQAEPAFIEFTRDNYTIRWYIPEHQIESRMRETKYILGMDTSEAIGKDSITMVLLDSRDLSTVMTCRVNDTNLMRFGDFVSEFMIRYENIILIPERKSTGLFFIDTLIIRLQMAGQDPFKRIYNLIVDEATEREDDYRVACMDMTRRPRQFNEANKKFFGFNTSGSGRHSRDALYSDTLSNAAKMAGFAVRDVPLIDEILGLEVKNGRIDHTVEGHDDMVIAWLLAIWMLMFSKNLRFYGITEAMVNVREFKGKQYKEPTAFEKFEEIEQKQIREEVEALFTMLKKTADDVLCIKIENRIKTLNSRLKDEYVESKSIDSLIKEAQTERTKTLRQARYHGSSETVRSRKPVSNYY